jgi:dihydrofolate reductase
MTAIGSFDTNFHLSFSRNTLAMKILMLHGFAQNGSLFKSKLRRLEERLRDIYPDVSFYYPTAPLKLDPFDQLSNTSTFEDISQAGQDIEAYSWMAHNEHAAISRGYYESLSLVANILRTEGPIDGIVAFSQGTVVAGFIASLLQGHARRVAFDIARINDASTLPFPEIFKNLNHPPLKFMVLYGPTISSRKNCNGYYQKPAISTPVCHVLGQWDTVIDCSDTAKVTRIIAGLNGRPTIIRHPGAHHAPMGKKYVDEVVAFIRKQQSRRRY